VPGWRHTPAPTTSSEFIVVIGNRGDLRSLLSAVLVLVLSEGRGVNDLALRQLCCILLSPPSAAGGCAIPACGLFDMAVLMSSSHRLLVLSTVKNWALGSRGTSKT
jgi:hypothetical protein